MWCEYACNAEKINFLTYTNSTAVDTGDEIIDYANVNFNIDSDYACEIFQSCKQVGFIAQAGISSSLAFLDFLGVNG